MAYLPKLNPTVGGGLGGLPERRVVSSILSTSKFNFGDVYEKDDQTFSVIYSGLSTRTGSFGDPNAVSFVTKVASNKYLVPYYYFNGSVNITMLKSVSVSSSGIVVSTNSHTIGDSSTRNFSCYENSGFMSGNDYIQLFCPNGNAAKINVDTLSYSTVFSGFTLPTSVTILSGAYAGQSFSYSGTANNFFTGHSKRTILDNNNSTGTVLVFGSVNGVTSIVGLVYNGSATLVDSFVIARFTNLPTLASVIIGWFEKVGDKIVFYISVTYSTNLVSFAVTFNTIDKTHTLVTGTTVTVSTSSISGVRFSTSKNSAALETIIGTQTSCYTFLLQNRLPYTPYSPSYNSVSLAKQFVTGIPYIDKNNDVFMLGQNFLGYGQSAAGISPIYSTSSDSLGSIEMLPLVTKYEDYLVNSASGYPQLLATPNVVCAYIKPNDVTTVSGNYNVLLLANTDPVVDDEVFLCTTSDQGTTNNIFRLGFVLLRKKS